MIKIENFDNCESSIKTYGGHSGSKKGVIYNGENWLLKFPKTTRSMEIKGDLSYTTTPLSEYLGSHIYELVGFDTHETKLGVYNEKLVVACKDFLQNDESILDYNSIKNEYDENVDKYLEKINISTTSSLSTNMEELKIIMENNPIFKKINLKEHFWDMFIIDAFINNNDRNENNWGLKFNATTKALNISPVFDNGAAFYGKTSELQFENYLNDKDLFKNVVYHSAVSSFEMNDTKINPLKYIENMDDEDCNEAVLRIFPKIDLEKIFAIFDEIPDTYNGINVCTSIQKEFYKKTLEYKYNEILLPIYNKLKNQN